MSEEKSDKYIFTISSPLGHEVGLTHQQMEEHISSRHPEVELNDVQQTIETPDAIYVSKWDSNRDLYFMSSSTHYDKMFTKVIVQENNEKIDEVVTAFYVEEIKGVNENGLKYIKHKL